MHRIKSEITQNVRNVCAQLIQTGEGLGAGGTGLGCPALSLPGATVSPGGVRGSPWFSGDDL